MPSFLLAATDESSGGLIDVVPGLMIWTLICFAHHVLRPAGKFAFGPIQKTIDERRDRIRAAVDEADKARDEARELLEQHRQLIADAKGEAAGILADARKVGDAQIERVKEESEVDRARRLEETKRQIDAETKRSLAMIRSEVADLTLEATARVTGKVLDAGGPAPAHRRGDRGARLLRAGEGHSLAWAVAQRMYARALFEAAQEADRVDAVAADLAALAAAIGRRARVARLSPQPADRPRRQGRGARAAGGGRRRARPATSSGSRRRRAARARSRSSARSSTPSSRRSQNRLSVELTTSYELSDDEAQSIVQTIEKASGRTVEATRSVDPSLIGGIVLQVGSHRADGSVRGRLERLRHELATAR